VKLAFEFIKTHEHAILPCKNHANDTGYDVYSTENVCIPARGSNIVPVGLQFACIPEGYWVRVESRSGLGFKHGVMAHPGIIDNGYRGDAGIKLYNLTNNVYTVNRGDRIAQFVLYPLVSDVAIGFTEMASESERGDKGFGSSGK
jgi:dUTP pyrophosphatase